MIIYHKDKQFLEFDYFLPQKSEYVYLFLSQLQPFAVHKVQVRFLPLGACFV